MVGKAWEKQSRCNVNLTEDHTQGVHVCKHACPHMAWHPCSCTDACLFWLHTLAHTPALALASAEGRGVSTSVSHHPAPSAASAVLARTCTGARQATSQQQQNSSSMHQRMQAVYANAMHCLMICLTDQSCKPGIYHFTHKK